MNRSFGYSDNVRRPKSVDMRFLNLVEKYLDGEMSLPELHAELLAGEWAGTASERLVSRALRLLGEATSADWPDQAVREELHKLHTEAWLYANFAVERSDAEDARGDDFDTAMLTFTHEEAPQVA